MVVIAERRRGGSEMFAEATVKLKVGDRLVHEVAEGDGPVHALDRALRKALEPSYPSLREVRLADYKVRILDPESATGAKTRVLIEARARRGALEHHRRLAEHHRSQRRGPGGQPGAAPAAGPEPGGGRGAPRRGGHGGGRRGLRQGVRSTRKDWRKDETRAASSMSFAV